MYTPAAAPTSARSTASRSMTTPAPRFVAIVRPESAVTSTRHWPVGASPRHRAEHAADPERPEVGARNRRRAGPRPTEPTKVGRSPREARPAAVLAAEPPATSPSRPRARRSSRSGPRRRGSSTRARRPRRRPWPRPRARAGRRWRGLCTRPRSSRPLCGVHSATGHRMGSGTGPGRRTRATTVAAARPCARLILDVRDPGHERDGLQAAPRRRPDALRAARSPPILTPRVSRATSASSSR